jgi:hypothetical protein
MVSELASSKIPTPYSSSTKNQVPIGRKITYSPTVCRIRSQKQETPHRCLAIGGNLMDYPHSIRAPTVSITTMKTFFNSVVSTTGAKFMGFDIKDFYLLNTNGLL